MKQISQLFSILLPLLFLAFSLYPCADRFDANVSNNNTSISYLTTQHTNTTHQVDNCSPLCACSCCAASTIKTIVLDLNTIDFQSPVTYTPTYYQGNTNGAYLSIWQPPQLT